MGRFYVMGDLNGWFEDRVRDDVAGAFRVLDENENGRRFVYFCAERELYITNTFFKHKSSLGWLEAEMEFKL